MDWRPFKLINASEQSWLARRAAQAATDWLAQWLPGEALGGAARCHAASERDATTLATEPARWIRCSLRDGLYVAVAMNREPMRVLAANMFGEPTDRGRVFDGDAPGIVGDVLSQACGDLGQRLLALAVADSAERSAQAPAADVWQRGSGAAIVEVPVSGRHIALLLSAPCVAKLLAARRPLPRARTAALTDPRQCIGARKAQLLVLVGDVSIELGVLQTLTVGDVISLDARIDQPLRVTVEGRETGRRAFLGSVQGNRAVQLAPVQRQ